MRSDCERFLQRGHGFLQVPRIETSLAQSEVGVWIIGESGGKLFEPLLRLICFRFSCCDHPQVIAAVRIIGGYRKFGHELLTGIGVALRPLEEIGESEG